MPSDAETPLLLMSEPPPSPPPLTSRKSASAPSAKNSERRVNACVRRWERVLVPVFAFFIPPLVVSGIFQVRRLAAQCDPVFWEQSNVAGEFATLSLCFVALILVVAYVVTAALSLCE